MDFGLDQNNNFAAAYTGQQQRMATLAGTEAQTEHTKASTNYMNALATMEGVQAATAQLDLDTQQKIADLNSIASDGEPVDPMEALTRDAGIYLQSGQVKKGADLLKAASSITSQQATAVARKVAADSQQERQTLQQLGKFDQMLGAATSQEDWDRAKQEAIAVNPKNRAMIDKMGDYSPEKAAYYQNAIRSYRDKMTADNQRRRTDIYEKVQDQEIQRKQALMRVDEEKLDLQRQRESRLAKQGGKQSKDKPAGMPTKAELGIASDALKEAGVDYGDSDSMEVASQARMLWKNNPGLTPPMATLQVIEKMKKDGSLTPETKGGMFGIGSSKGQVFSASRPVPAPSNRSDLIKGQFYRAPNGVVGQYTGKGFRTIDTGSADEGGEE